MGSLADAVLQDSLMSDISSMWAHNQHGEIRKVVGMDTDHKIRVMKTHSEKKSRPISISPTMSHIVQLPQTSHLQCAFCETWF